MYLMQKLKIAFYSDSYLPAVDGVVTSMLEFKRELERRGHKVYIFASAKMEDKKKYAAKDVFLHAGFKFKPYPQYSVALFPYYSSMPTQLRKLKIDIVHVQTPFVMGFTGMLAAKLSRLPLVGTFHTMINSSSLNAYYPKNRALRNFYAKYLWKYTQFFYRSCDATIAPSNSVASMLKRHRIKDVHVVPNSVDTRMFNAGTSGAAFRKRLGIGKRESVVLYVGRISKEKRVDVMLRAARILLRKRKGMRFVVCGTGPELEANKKLANRLGVANRTSFIGFVEHSKLPEVYAASDLLCLPSHRFETQGIVAIEAMAAGRPVVGSDDLALKDLIKSGKNGEKFRSLDYADCARKIEKVLNNKAAYTKHAVETAGNFSTERVTDELLKTYELLLSKQAVY